MCLAVPMRVLEATATEVVCEVFGNRRTARVDALLADPLEVGAYVIVSRGTVLRTVPEDEAQESQALFREILDRDGAP